MERHEGIWPKWTLSRVCLWFNLVVALLTMFPSPCRMQASSGATCVGSVSNYSSDEQRLHGCLLAGLDPTVRPARKAQDTVTVRVSVVMVKLLELDEKSHTMTTTGWIHQSWEDFQLSWTPAAYGGLEHIRLPIGLIWTPDVVLFNNADESFQYIYDKLAVVAYNGTVTWVPHARLHTYCDLDLRRFPFDTQTCSVVFGSWTHDTKAVNITAPEIDHPKYTDNGNEWTVHLFTSERHTWLYRDNLEYAGIISKMSLERTSSFYQYTFIMPTVMIALLALLIPFLDPRTNERITYCVALTLGCVLVLMMLDNHMPTAMGTVPVVAAYLAYLMVMIAILLIFSVLVVNMCHRDHKQGKVPGWVRWMFLTKLNKLVCVQVEPYTALPLEFTIDENNVERELLDMRNGASDFQTPDTKTQLERTLEDIRRYLRVCASRTGARGPSETHSELVLQEWLEVARVIDRLTFVSFFVLTVVITISMYAHY